MLRKKVIKTITLMNTMMNTKIELKEGLKKIKLKKKDSTL